MEKRLYTKLIVASLLNLAPEELINFRETPDGGAIAIAPTGQKFKFSAEELAARGKQLETELPGESFPVSKVDTEDRALSSVEGASPELFEGSGNPVSKLETEKRQPAVKSVSKSKRTKKD